MRRPLMRSPASSESWASAAPSGSAPNTSIPGASDCPAMAVPDSKPPPLTGATITDRKSHTSELQSLMRISYAVFCLKKKNKLKNNYTKQNYIACQGDHSTSEQ